MRIVFESGENRKTLIEIADAEMDKMQIMLRTHNTSEWMWLNYFELLMAMASVVSAVTIVTLLFDWPSNGDFITIYHTFRVM